MSRRCIRVLFAFAFCHALWAWLAGCAGDDAQVKSVEVDVLTKTQSVAMGTDGQPEPIYSTSFAIRLAELTLKERGVDCQHRDVLVSYCDGIYTVKFERPQNEIMAKDYVVHIEADTSRIVRVELGE